MGRKPQEARPLLEGLVDQPEVELLEVAQAAVDQAGTAPRGAARDVALFHERGAEAAARCVEQRARADDAAADDEDVERLVGEARAGGRAAGVRAAIRIPRRREAIRQRT